MFPDNKDYIEKGLKLGIHLIDKISFWTKSKYNYDDKIEHVCKDYRDNLHAHLEFTTDCRFQRLEYLPTLYGLQKIGMMGILTKKLPKQWKWNPVDTEVDKNFLGENENAEDNDKFILECLKKSIQERRSFYNKRKSGEESSQPNKR